MDAHEEPVDIDCELRVVTHASVWLIRTDRYMRTPRVESPRPPAVSPALADLRWHHHDGVWKVVDATGFRYRILPSGRPAGAHGIYTGDVVAADPVDGNKGGLPALGRAQERPQRCGHWRPETSG